jgi:hypothetical protein
LTCVLGGALHCVLNILCEGWVGGGGWGAGRGVGGVGWGVWGGGIDLCAMRHA